MTSAVRIGTRGSALALVQVHMVCDALSAAHPDRRFELITVKTTGDRVQDVPLSQIGGAGAFTAELETALREGRVDAAVHSLKDLPTKMPDGLVLGAVPERENVHDALVSRGGMRLHDLPEGAVIGTSSVRRRAQLLAARQDLQIRDIRGNVETRLQKVEQGKYDATILACAGLRRLGLEAAISEVLSLDLMLPAPAQGALAVQCRDEPEWLDLLEPLHDPEVSACVRAERAFLDACGGGCSMPVGAYAYWEEGMFIFEGRITAPDGSKAYGKKFTASANQVDTVGYEFAQVLLDEGARAIVDDVLESRSA